jgi:gliding motility-associated-like protein
MQSHDIINSKIAAKKIILFFFFLFAFYIFGYSQLISIEIKVTGDIHTLCEGDTAELSVMITGSNIEELKYFWENRSGDNNIINDPHSPSVIINPSKNDVFTVTVVETKRKDTLTTSVSIGIIALPKVYAGPDDSACMNEIYYFNQINIINETDKRWFHNGKGTLIDDVIPHYIPIENETGQIHFILTGISEYCRNVSDTVVISYFPLPEAEIITESIILCDAEEVNIEGRAKNHTGFTWEVCSTIQQDGYLINESTLHPTFIPDPVKNGEVKIVLHVNNQGCIRSDTISIQIQRVIIDPLKDTVICYGETILLDVYSAEGNNYLWNTGENTAYIIVKPEYTQEYAVEVTNQYGCTFYDDVVVEVIPLPVIDLEMDFTNQLIYVNPPGLYRYIFYGSNKTVLQDGASSQFYYGDAILVYDTIFVEVITEEGCSSDANNKFHVFTELPQIKKVNAFSPNDDGINDRLLPGHKITVFDRTFEIIYEGWEGWDGNFNGEALPQGTYFYVAYGPGGEVYYKGPVFLIR